MLVNFYHMIFCCLHNTWQLKALIKESTYILIIYHLFVNCILKTNLINLIIIAQYDMRMGPSPAVVASGWIMSIISGSLFGVKEMLVLSKSSAAKALLERSLSSLEKSSDHYYGKLPLIQTICRWLKLWWVMCC